MSTSKDAAARRAFIAREDPFALFTEWLAEAETSEINDANAMAVASVDGSCCQTCAWFF